MHDSCGMCGRQRRRYLLDDIQNIINRQLLRSNQLPNRQTIDKLSGYEMNSILFSDFVNREYVRMVQRRRRSRFTLKAPQARVVRRKVSRQEFQGDEPAESCVLGQVDFAHSTCAEPLDDSIWTKLPTDVALEIVTEKHICVVCDCRLLDEVARLVVSGN